MSHGYENTVKKMVEMAAGKRILFWGMDIFSKYIYEDFKQEGVNIEYFVSDEIESQEYDKKEVRRSIELFYEDPEQVFIVVWVMTGHGGIYDKLVGMGFRETRDFYIGGIGGYFDGYDVVDVLLGYNKYYNDRLGFYIFEEESLQVDQYTILILGGSTTVQNMGNNTSWPEYLYKKIKKYYKNIVIINGALGGYGTQQEFLKLLRDGLEYHPNMLITFDGLNDINCLNSDVEYPFLHPYGKKVFARIEEQGDFAPDTLGLRNSQRMVYGTKQNYKKDYQRWIETIRKIHAIAEEFGIRHVGFLQPMIKTGNAVLGEQQKKVIEGIYEADHSYRKLIDGMTCFYKNVISFVQEKDYMYDLTEIFDNKELMYYDICHATDKGNEVIADAVYSRIKTIIQEENK